MISRVRFASLCGPSAAARSTPTAVRAAAAVANLRDDPLGFRGAAAEVNQNLGARLSELERAGAPNAARGAGDESRFS